MCVPDVWKMSDVSPVPQTRPVIRELEASSSVCIFVPWAGAPQCDKEGTVDILKHLKTMRFGAIYF